MKSKADPDFWQLFNKLPQRVQKLARKNYAQWLGRVGDHYRPTGYFLTSDTFVWTWMGTHEEYNKL